MSDCKNSKSLLQKILYKIKLWEMDLWWNISGERCNRLFPPSFYYTHSKEEVKRITAEAVEELRKVLNEE